MDTDKIASAIIDLIVKHLDAQGSDRSVAKKANISNTLIGNFRKGTSMKLDTMEKILKAYPELRRPIADILLGEITEKHTAASLSKEAAEWRMLAEKHRKAADALARINLMNAQTIAELTGREVIKEA